jgi:DnaJ family protein A protein 5
LRKRDPRYKTYLAQQSAGPSGTATPSNAASAAATARKRAAATEAFVAQSWQAAPTGSRNQDYADLEWSLAENTNANANGGGSDGEDEEEEEWECVVCGKSFRSEAAWDSHERSKKHLKEVERLKMEMLEEEEELGLGDAEAELKEFQEMQEARELQQLQDLQLKESLAKEGARDMSEDGIEGDGNGDSVEDEVLAEERKDDDGSVPIIDTPNVPDDPPQPKTQSVKHTAKPTQEAGLDDFDALPSRKKGKKARRRNDFGLDDDDDLPISGLQTPVGLDSAEPAVASLPEMSKKDKRRAREAEKKAKEEAESLKAPVSSCYG